MYVEIAWQLTGREIFGSLLYSSFLCVFELGLFLYEFERCALFAERTVASWSSNQFSLLVLNDDLKTFPATEDRAHDCRFYLGCTHDDAVYESDFLDMFCSDFS